MSVGLVLIGGSTPEAPLTWVRLTAGGAVTGRGILASGVSLPQTAPSDTVLVLPGSEAQVRTLDQPAASPAQARAAAAYLFKGALAADPKQVVYVVGDRADDAPRLAAAFDRDRIDQWMKRCAAAGARPSMIHLDCTLWPAPAGVVQIVRFADRTIVAGGRSGGFSIETDLAASLIGPWLEKAADGPAHVETVGFDAAELGLTRPGVRTVTAPALDPVEVLARAAASPPGYAPVLRLAEYSAGPRSAASLRPWRLVALLSVLAILLQAGLAVYDGLEAGEAAKRTLASAESEFHRLRPDVKRIVNLRAQVSAALNTAQPPRLHPIIPASGLIARVLQSHGEVRLDEVRYDAVDKRIALRLSGAQPDLLDAAIADLRSQSADLEAGQLETAAGRVSVAITMAAS